MSAGHLDHPPAGTRFDAGELVLSGWVAFAEGPTSRVEAWLGERPLGRARLGLPRPDVSAVIDAADAAVSGFELRVGIEPGGEREETLRVVATAAGGERHEFEPVPIVLAAPSTAAAASAPRQPRSRPGGGRRVLAFTNVLTLGGASTYFVELLREMQRQGRVEATAVTAIDGPLRADLEAVGIPVHVLSSVPLHDLDAYLDRLDELVAWATPSGFELVFVNTVNGLTLPGADLAARLGLPAVWSVHESFHPALLWDSLAPALRARGEAALGAGAFAVFQAEATRQLYLDSFGPRSEAIPYGLDLEPIEAVRQGFDRAAERRRAGIPEDAELAICVGTVEPRKAQIPLAQAFELLAEQHPRAELAFVGSDEGAATSEALAARIRASPFAARMRMVPRTRAVQRWFGMADLLVCAADVESLPKTAVEALAWGVPVLATDVFGLPELIAEGENGWLCEAGDVGALAAGLERALGSGAEERRQLGAAGRELVLERHDLPTYGKLIADVFDRAAGA